MHSVLTPLPALEQERHFALVDGLRLTNLGSLLIVGVRTQSDPTGWRSRTAGGGASCWG